MHARFQHSAFRFLLLALLTTTTESFAWQSIQAIGGVGNGLVRDHRKNSNAAPDFPDDFDERDELGGAVVPLGDLDGDGVQDSPSEPMSVRPHPAPCGSSL